MKDWYEEAESSQYLLIPQSFSRIEQCAGTHLCVTQWCSSPSSMCKQNCYCSKYHHHHGGVPIEEVRDRARQPSATQLLEMFEQQTHYGYVLEAAADMAAGVVLISTGEELRGSLTMQEEEVEPVAQLLTASADWTLKAAHQLCEELRLVWRRSPAPLELHRSDVPDLSRDLISRRDIEQVLVSGYWPIELAASLKAIRQRLPRVRYLLVESPTLATDFVQGLQTTFPELESIVCSINELRNTAQPLIGLAYVPELALLIHMHSFRLFCELQLYNLSNLTKLSLVVQGRDARYLSSELLADIERLPRFEQLTLGLHRFSLQNWMEFVDVFCNYRKLCKLFIHPIYFTGNSHQHLSMVDRLIAFLERLNHLQSISIHTRAVCQEPLFFTGQSFKVLKEIQIGPPQLWDPVSSYIVPISLSALLPLQLDVLIVDSGQQNPFLLWLNSKGHYDNMLQSLCALNSQVAVLARMRSLHTLSLRGILFGDQTMNQLCRFDFLTSLNLSNNHIQEGSQYLGQLWRLRKLTYQNNRLTIEGARALASLNRLEELHLLDSVQQDLSYSEAVTRQCVRNLLSCRRLESVSLEHCVVSNQSISILVKHPSLRVLKMDSNYIGDEGVQHMTRLTGLSTLVITNNIVVTHLVRLYKLSRLQVLKIGSKIRMWQIRAGTPYFKPRKPRKGALHYWQGTH